MIRKIAPLIVALAISGLSLVELFSIDPITGMRQLAWIGVGVMVFLLFYKALSLDYLDRFSSWLFWLSVVLLLAVLVLGGPGVKRWFSLGFVKFQPSEFAKLALVLMLARLLSERPPGLASFWKAMASAGLVFALIFVEPDLATAGSIAVLISAILLVSGVDLGLLVMIYAPVFAAPASASVWSFLGLAGLAFAFSRWRKKSWGYTLTLLTLITGVGLATPLVWNKALKPYQRKRIISFVSPASHKTAAGWQALQARIAIGSGGFWGKGFGKGTQKDLKFLPEAHTDFIFAAMAEEFGFVASAAILLLFALLLWSMVRAAVFLEDQFLRNIAVGAMVIIFYHAVFNLLSVLGLFPVAGIPLPFASYGGSHLLMEFALLGLVAAGVEEQERRMVY